MDNRFSRFLFSFGLASFLASVGTAGEMAFGPLLHDFKLTLDRGERTEAIGPLFYRERQPEIRTWAIPPLMSYKLDEGVDASEFDFVYPLLTYDRFGEEYRYQLFQWLSWSGGRALKDTNVHRFTLFPLYFQQRSKISERNYTAVWPFFGRVENRLFRDEIEFVLWPIYVKTRRGAGSALSPESFTAPVVRNIEARRSGVTTYNYLLPLFHVRRADGLKGWQFWPLAGHEHKEVTYRTNIWGEAELVAGHDKLFSLWPVYFRQDTGIGTENPAKARVVLPFYSSFRSPLRDSTSYGWPLGVTVTDDRARKYHEIGAPWPFVVFANGEGKTTRRVWPFYSRASNTNIETGWYLWPLYRFKRIDAAPLERERNRVLFFLYSDTREKNTETGSEYRRRESWPLFQHRRERDGRERLQILSLLEPFAPTSHSIERNYSPLWSLWRAESNPQTGTSSQSFLWNLYRRDVTPESRKCSLLFGLFQYQSAPDVRRWRLFCVPFGTKKTERPSAAAL